MFPIMLNIRGRKCTVAGGGNVAERKVKTLLKYGADVTAVSPVFKDRAICNLCFMTLSRFELCLSFQINIFGCEKSLVNVFIHRVDRHIQFWMICKNLIRELPLFNQRRNNLVFLM